MNLKRVISIGTAVVLLVSVTTIRSTYATEYNKNNDQESNIEYSIGDNQGLVSYESAEVSRKSEVVYARLSAAGAVSGIYVVNHFEVAKGGGITDYGSYHSLKNLTNNSPITMEGDVISILGEEGDFYYQGNIDGKDLPWIIEIAYELNGSKISPQDLAGKSGELDIQINIKGNDKVEPVFYENYMLQISLTLPTDKCNSINAPEATFAEAGNNTMLSFTVLPDTEADFSVTSKVTDFEMRGIEISAIPFSMSIDMPDTDGMLKDLEKLPEAIKELRDGVGELEKGTIELKKGAESIRDGSDEFNQGLSELSNNSSGITGASAQIKDALAMISSSISSSTSKVELSTLTQLPLVLNELSLGLKGISDGLSELKDGYLVAYMALDNAILSVPDTYISKDQMDTLFQDANDEQLALLDQLYTSYMAGQSVKGTYAQVKQAFASVAPALDNVTASLETMTDALDEMSSSMGSALSNMDINTQFTQLAQGLAELAENYTQFHDGLLEYLSGVGTLSAGYQQFNSGVSDFVNGVASVQDGVSELYDGTNTMNNEISTLPDQLQKEMDRLMKKYDKSDFETTSFVSQKNTNTTLVQFVLKCENIELPEDIKTAASEDQKETVMDRFLALFKRKND